ncbi:hypothetical protein [Labedaea rhizosphaerae]|uniref:Excreted virulence factor EspC (Type VII ESX diderm) n=1 Tax=Labedaea rhizosphaerae TaxID=598644 RepID=A0A4R6RZX3_LABRH|nr:hypothetical protein [Labedaea rhizosphaerae]TDP91866.1 hypothetical protein EV186_10876 [Labedaea rhizosphaerae]
MSGFELDVAALRKIANDDLPSVASTLNTQAAAMVGLERMTGTINGSVDGSTAAFGTMVPAAGQVGWFYNAMMDALAHVGMALGESVSTASGRLKVIADNYEHVDRAVAGD